MAANLPPQYIETRKKLQGAKDPTEKIRIIEELLSIIPKHKATEKIQAELKSKLSKFRQVQAKKKGTGKRSNEFYISKEGAGQVIIIGSPNSGKSSLLAVLTNATPEIAAYPYTTRTPLSGMFKFENVPIQLIDLPPIHKEEIKPWVFALIRNADIVILLLDLSSDPLEQFETITNKLLEKNIKMLLKNTFEEDSQIVEKRTLAVGNKIDLTESKEILEIIEELNYFDFKILPISTITGENLDKFGQEIYRLLNIIRVYTKSPGKEAEFNMPIILKLGSTVLDAASSIHKDFVQKLKYAKIYNPSREQDLIIAHEEFRLIEGDVIEFHI